MLFICSLSPRTQPLSSSMHLFSFRSFHLRLVFYCSSSPARCPSLWWRVHGCGLSKTLSLLAKPERRSLQEKCEPAGQAKQEDPLSKTTLRQRLNPHGGRTGSLLKSEPGYLSLAKCLLLRRRDALFPLQELSSYLGPRSLSSCPHLLIHGHISL